MSAGAPAPAVRVSSVSTPAVRLSRAPTSGGTPAPVSVPDVTLLVAAPVGSPEPPPSSQCPSPIDSMRLERARQTRLSNDDDDDDRDLDGPLLAPDLDDEAEDETTQFNSTSFWTYVDHILCAVRADAKARSTSTEEYEKILNEYVGFNSV